MLDFLNFSSKKKKGSHASSASNSEEIKTKRQLTKTQGILGVTIILSAMTFLAVSDFSPGNLQFDHKPNSKREAKIGEFSGNRGEKLDVEMDDGDKIASPRVKKKQKEMDNMQLPSFPNFGGNKSPTIPNLSRPSPTQEIPKYDPSMVYAKHISIVTNIKDVLNPSFEMKRLSDPPSPEKQSLGRFIATYAIGDTDTDTVTEQFEVLSIVRTNRMEEIKTAKDAMDALMEESESVNVLDANDDYLIYDFAGDRGYQVGKISVDENGIYILGYVNLTTNDMPTILKKDWVEKIKKL